MEPDRLWSQRPPAPLHGTTARFVGPLLPLCCVRQVETGIGARSRGMRSPFRPDSLSDAAVLDNHKPLIRSLERRGLIRGGLSLGALVMLTGCDVKRPEAVESALLAISRFNDGVQALLFDPSWRRP